MSRNWKQIEDSRDRRLWVTQVFIPISGIAIAALQFPEVRDSVVKFFEGLGDGCRQAGEATASFIRTHIHK